MDFKQLKYFIAIAEEGSMSSAARNIPIAQPALTRQIRLLEESVGAALFTRSQKGIVLTQAGESFYRDTKRLLNEFELAKRNASAIASGRLGTLSLSVTVMHLWVPQITELISQFRHAYPDISIKIFSLLSGPQVDAIRQGRLDIGMLFFPPEDDDELSSRCLYKDRLVLVTSKGSRLATQLPNKLADLNGEDFIWFDRAASPAYHDKLIHSFQKVGFTPHVIQEGADNATMMSLVATGMGCTILPEMTMAGAPPGVISHRIPDLTLELPLMLVWRKDSRNPALHPLIDMAMHHPLQASPQGE
ncbi:LysR family transcriptional regulator [Oceanimonas baumannii]|uniref:LysR family transcriptional regulator n=1 Tax=Oceanimonas baumannii TaxID=129578 RepID=UPI001D18964D|nr:LysR family transcriptional regulator [Oceanimonas baumannii]MCC4264767.1 LysR family transcriptional regulator [Oceanimonas baumannii]